MDQNKGKKNKEIIERTEKEQRNDRETTFNTKHTKKTKKKTIKRDSTVYSIMRQTSLCGFISLKDVL